MSTTAHELECNACQTTLIASLSSIVFKPPVHTTGTTLGRLIPEMGLHDTGNQALYRGPYLHKYKCRTTKASRLPILWMPVLSQCDISIGATSCPAH